MLGRKVIEGKEDFFIFLQAFAGLRKFGLVTGDELIVSCQSRFAGRRQVHFNRSVAWPPMASFGAVESPRRFQLLNQLREPTLSLTMLVADRPEAFSPLDRCQGFTKISESRFPSRYNAGINASTLECPAHKPR